MFNRQKISNLEWRVSLLRNSEESQQKQIWQLRADLEQLMGYLKLTFVDVNERRIVAIKTFEKIKE